jgi:hypothetical protein
LDVTLDITIYYQQNSSWLRYHGLQERFYSTIFQNSEGVTDNGFLFKLALWTKYSDRGVVYIEFFILLKSLAKGVEAVRDQFLDGS